MWYYAFFHIQFESIGLHVLPKALYRAIELINAVQKQMLILNCEVSALYKAFVLRCCTTNVRL
jgi:hypothetical protein